MASEMENKDLQDQVSSHRADEDAVKNERLQQQGRIQRIGETASLQEDDDEFAARLTAYYEGSIDRVDELRVLAERAKKRIDDRTIIDPSRPATTNDKETK